MAGAELSKKEDKGSLLKAIIKGALVALSISLIGICIFAFVLRFVDIDVNYIKPINQIIKIVSILIGTMSGLRSINEMGLISGFLIGVCYTTIAFLVFSLLNGGFVFNASLINDLLFGGISGAIAGVIAVNFVSKKKRR